MSSDPPDPRNPIKDYEKGLEVYLEHLPELLEAEQRAREMYDPQRIQSSLDLQDQYGPQQTEEQLQRLRELDPHSEHVRGQLADRVYQDLASGYALPEDFEREIETDIRGAQTARGNYLGNGAATAEAAIKGRTAFDMYNRRLANAGTFLSTPSPVQQAAQIAPVMPDRQATYTVGGLNAGQQGAQLGQMAYNNAMQSHNAQPNPWATALGGAATGAQVGSAAGPYGAAIGAVVGGAAGYYASDERFKNSIEETGEKTADGIPIVTFKYNGIAQRYKGVIAQIAQKFRPDAVTEQNGRLMVNYEALGMQMVEVD